MADTADEMMRKMADVLERYTFSEVFDGEYAEGFNNEDVIDVLSEYEAFVKADH